MPETGAFVGQPRPTPGSWGTARRRARVFACLASIIAWLLIPGGTTALAAERLITIGSGSFGGVYFPAAGALCRLLNRETGRHGIRCVAESSSGSMQNVRDLIADATDFGIVQTDIQADAVAGRGRFLQAGQQKDLRALFALHAEPITILSRLDANVRDFAELRGRRVAFGPSGSGTRATMALLTESLGLDDGDFASIMDYGPRTAATALCENRIDAFAYVVGHPNQLVRGVSESCAVRVVKLAGDEIDSLLQHRPYLTPAMVPGGIYVGVDEPVMTIGVRASVLTTTVMSESVAYEMVRAVGDNLSALGGLHPALAGLELDDLRAGLTAPLHPGAVRYFDERDRRIP